MQGWARLKRVTEGEKQKGLENITRACSKEWTSTMRRPCEMQKAGQGFYKIEGKGATCHPFVLSSRWD